MKKWSIILLVCICLLLPVAALAACEHQYPADASEYMQDSSSMHSFFCELCSRTVAEKHSFTIKSEGDEHWEECSVCGMMQGRKNVHYAFCDDATHCAYCGVDYDGTNIRHTIDYTQYKTDAESHCRICKDCDEEVPYTRAAHYAYCDDPTHCAYCGVDYTGANIRHTGEDYDQYGSDAEDHWRVCGGCQAERADTRSAHYAYCDDSTH